MGKHSLFCLLLLIKTYTAYGQITQTTHYEQQVWGAYFTQIRFNQRWGIWLDAHYRSTERFIQKPSKFLIHGALSYYISEHLNVSNGCAFINHFPEIGHTAISQPEHRIWQQLQGHTNMQRSQLMNWIRLEERFRKKIVNDSTLGKGYVFDFCLRNNLQLTISFSKKGLRPYTLAGVLNNEVFINFFNPTNPTYTPFEQNRFFIGLAYQLHNDSSIQIGYLNVYQQLIANKEFKSINAIRVFYFQHLDLRRLNKRTHL